MSPFTPTQTIQKNGSTAWIPFLIGDVETPAELLRINARSDNPTLLSECGISISTGSQAQLIKLTPAQDQIGKAKVTVTVNDLDGGKTTREFTLVVQP